MDAVFSMVRVKYPETGEVCEVDGDNRSGGVTGLNCAGFGSAIVVTSTFGMVAASHILRKLAESVQPAQEEATEAIAA